MSRKQATVQVQQVQQIVRTPEELLTGIVEELTWENNAARRVCNDFAAKFAANPAYELSWSANVFKDAARLDVTTMLKGYIEHGQNQADEYGQKFTATQIIHEVRKELYSLVLRYARSPESSSSATSNEMSLCKNSQYAVWLEKFDRLIAKL